MIAGRRGLLSYGQLMKAITMGKFHHNFVDVGCASALAKPSWYPWWLWAPFSYKKCQSRAIEAAKRL